MELSECVQEFRDKLAGMDVSLLIDGPKDAGEYGLVVDGEKATVLDRAKGQALDLFKETKDKKPIKGVEIKIFTETNIEFDPSEALAWAVETGLCLKLDHEKFAKVSPILGLDFVKVTETSTPKAQLSRTL